MWSLVILEVFILNTVKGSQVSVNLGSLSRDQGSYSRIHPGDHDQDKKGPPQRRKEVENLIVANGEDIKMLCPVHGNPPPLVEWSKDGENIDYSWTRVKTNKNYLKLRSAQMSDTGVWECRAVNGFGSVSVKIELVVTETSKSETELLQIASPVFTKATQNLQTTIKKLTGESLMMKCEALGSPKPHMSWLHNGRPVIDSKGGTLKFDKLEENQSGIYTCLATNLAGTGKLQFSITVESPRVELPGIGHVDNVTVVKGEAAMLQCRVTSGLTPSIQWLRRVRPSKDGPLHGINLGGMELVTVGDGDTVTLTDSTYLSTLVINNVQEDQAGLYVCFATNTAGGFNYQSAHLTVEGHSLSHLPGVHDDHQLFLGLVVGLVSVVLVLLTIMFICLVKQNRNKMVLTEYAESQRSILYKNCTLDIKTGGGGGGYHDDAISWSSLQKKHPDTSTASVTSNIYDLPFSNHKESIINSSSGVRCPPVHYTPLVSGHTSVVHSPASSRVSRVTSLPSSPAMSPRNNSNTRHMYRQQTYLTQYQNL